MNIYLSDTNDFNNNGLGFLTDCLSASVVEEINGVYNLNIEYLLNGHLSEYLERENIIKCEVADGTKQLFRIKHIEKDFNRTIREIRKYYHKPIIVIGYPSTKTNNNYLNQ